MREKAAFTSQAAQRDWRSPTSGSRHPPGQDLTRPFSGWASWACSGDSVPSFPGEGNSAGNIPQLEQRQPVQESPPAVFNQLTFGR